MTKFRTNDYQIKRIIRTKYIRLPVLRAPSMKYQKEIVLPIFLSLLKIWKRLLLKKSRSLKNPLNQKLNQMRKNWLKIILKLKTNKIISLLLNIKRITKMILMVIKLLMIIKKISFKNKLSMIIKIIKCNYRFLISTKLLKLNLYLVFKQLKKLRYQKEKEMKDLWSRRNSATKIRCFYLTNKLIDLNSCHIKLKI